jgi:hypothetical protein
VHDAKVKANFSQSGFQILLTMLAWAPQNRCTAGEVLAHAYIRTNLLSLAGSTPV